MTTPAIDKCKSIEQLENSYWPPSIFDSNVILRAHAVRRNPLAELSLADISVALRQQVGVSYVIPMAIAVIEQDPFAESRFYPGDLLLALLRIPTDFWTAHEELRDRLQRAYKRAESDDRAQDEVWHDDMASAVKESHARFRGDLPSKPWLRPVENQRELGTWGAGQPDPERRIELVRAANRATA